MITAGVDEVGRGCLAGPVVSSAVILKESINLMKEKIGMIQRRLIDLLHESINQFLI